MEYISSQVSALRAGLYDLDFPLYFYSAAGQYLGCSKEDLSPSDGLSAAFQRLARPIGLGAAVPGQAYRVHPCRVDDALAFYALVPEGQAALVGPYLDALLPLITSRLAKETRMYTQHLRTMLTSQLANLENLASESASIIHTLGYSTGAWRAALLCSVPNIQARDEGLQPSQLQADVLASCVEACAACQGDDIFGLLSNNQFLIFKAVPTGSFLSNADYLNAFLEELCGRLLAHFSQPVTFSVGSAYDSCTQLNMSYQEASFLLTNRAFLQPGGQRHLFIHYYLAEYLASTHLAADSQVIFRDYNALNARSPLLADTAVALSQNDYVLSRSSRQLGLHRNTMIQRYHKLADTYRADPLHQTGDRLMIRTQLLPQVCAITWNAGVHIQANSLQYNGLVKLSEVLYRVSHGTIHLNVHHISTLGDNQQLLKIIGNDSLDLGICACSALYSISEDLASLIEQPFLFDSVEQSYALLNQLVLPLLATELRNLPFISPAFWVIGSRHITSRGAPIRKPEDLRGKSVRTMSTGALYRYFQRLGAQPVSIVYGELHRALSTGLVDCQENPYVNILGIDLSDVQHYVNDMVYYYNISPLFISKKAWQGLTAQQQGYLQQAIRETTHWLMQEQAAINARCRGVLQRDKGMTIVMPTEAEKRLWLREAKAMWSAHPLQRQLRTLLKAKEIYHAKGSLESDLQELLHRISEH